MKCLICNVEIIQLKRGRKKNYCSKICRQKMNTITHREKYAIDKKCLFCKNIFKWQPYAKYCSIDCRRFANNAVNRTKKTISICTICGNEAIGAKGWVRKYCSFECQLQGIYGGKPPLSERSRKAQRNMRERSAPGLNIYELRLLRQQWKDEGRLCFYCFGPFDTIDHIIPLMRGGDNMETNLVPCCRKCNSSKGSKLLAEWKPEIYA